MWLLAGGFLRVPLERFGVRLELLLLQLLRAAHGLLDPRLHVRYTHDDQARLTLIQGLTEGLEVVAAHPCGRMSSHRTQERPTGRGHREQSGADRGDREERDREPGSRPGPATQHATDPGRRLVLARDLHLAVPTAVNDRRVVDVHQPLPGMELLDQAV